MTTNHEAWVDGYRQAIADLVGVDPVYPDEFTTLSPHDDESDICGHQLSEGSPLCCTRDKHNGNGHVYIGRSVDDRRTKNEEGLG